MLHNSANHHIFTVGKGVDIDFDCVFEEVINEDRAVVRILDSLLHVANDGFFVVGNHHGATAEDIGGSQQHGISDLAGSFDGFLNRSGHRAGGLGNLQVFQQLVEMLAVFGKVNRFWRSADDV